MSFVAQNLDRLLEKILAFPTNGQRRLIALAGAPGSGKSTMAMRLAGRLSKAGRKAQVVPMDGFHLDNRILRARGLLDRKGAPETFDLSGFRRLLSVLRSDAEIFYPIFDRSQDIAISGAGVIAHDCKFVIVEGNYLLLDEPGWRELSDYWTLSVWLDVPLPELRARSITRWLEHGFSMETASQRADTNDLPNARRVIGSLTRHDVEIRSGR